MAERLQLPTAIWRVQYDLLGGHRRVLTIVVVCMVVFGAGILAADRLTPTWPFSRLGPIILGFLAVIHALVVVLVGSNGVHRAMLRDYESKMVESHRLTPMSNLAVPLGYLFGSTIQVIVLSFLIIIVGAVVSFAAGLPVDSWIYGNLFLLNGVVTIWAAIVFFGLRPEKPFNPAPVVLGIAALTFPIAMVPGAAILFNLYPILLALMMLTGNTPVADTALVIVASLNLVFTIFWLTAAAAKYRRPDLPALNAGRGLMLLLMVLIVSTGGLIAFDKLASTTIPVSNLGPNLGLTQWISTMVGVLLLSAAAINGAVKCRILGATGTALRDWPDRVSPLLVAVLSAVMICVVMAGLGQPVWSKMFVSEPGKESRAMFLRAAWIYSFDACLLATLSFRSLFELGYTLFKTPRTLFIVFLFLVWGLPLMVDSMRAEYVRGFSDPVGYSWLFAVSPVGTIIAAWSKLDILYWPGFAFQFTLTALLMIIARRARRRVGSVQLTMES